MLLGGQRLADIGKPCNFFISWRQPSQYRHLSKLHVASDIAHAEDCSRIICTTCSLNFALNVLFSLLFIALVQVVFTYRGVLAS